MQLRKLWLNINGADRMVVCDPEKDTLADLLRRLGLTGVKMGCGIGVCGVCSVLLDGKVVKACVKKMKSIPEFSKIVTIEGVGTPMHLHPLQQAFITYGGVQCGFCIPGFIVSAYALLQQNLNPTREDVRAWFKKNHNYCRCTGYKQIVDAVMAAARVMRGEATMEDIQFHGEGKRYYNSKLPRPSALAKVCGTADYGEDVSMKMPGGTLYVAPVQPRITHHAKILSIDTSEAEKMPGVVRVITAKDVYAIGGNVECARLSGINVKRMKMIIYVLNGCMACVAGLMVSFRLGSAQTDIGTTYGMDAITACCLGGTAMGGGKGYMFGTILGVIFLSSLSTGFNLMNVNAYYQQIIKGVVLLVAIAFNARSGNTFKRKEKAK